MRVTHNGMLGRLTCARACGVWARYLASSTEIEERGTSGRYFVPLARELPCSPAAADRSLQRRLWQFSETALGLAAEAALPA